MLLSLVVHAAVLSIVVDSPAPLNPGPAVVVSLKLHRPTPEPLLEQWAPPTALERIVEAPARPVRFKPAEIELLEIRPQASQDQVAGLANEAPIDDPVLTRRILSSQFGVESESERTWLTRVDEMAAPDPDAFLIPQRASMDVVLNTPSLQLPFEDRRIYLIDSYSSGLEGSIERFWDRVTLPFGWTTKGGTHFECAWILIVAGCAWGPNELFYRELKRREKES